MRKLSDAIGRIVALIVIFSPIYTVVNYTVFDATLVIIIFLILFTEGVYSMTFAKGWLFSFLYRFIESPFYCLSKAVDGNEERGLFVLKLSLCVHLLVFAVYGGYKLITYLL
jgi:hypothetical protein